MPDHIAAETPSAPPAELTIELNPPAKFATVEYPRLQLREPSAGDLVACDALTGYAWTTHMVHKVSGVPEEAVMKIRATELLEAGKYLLGFIVAGQRTSSAG